MTAKIIDGKALSHQLRQDFKREADALRIGRQVLRDNALELFPQLKARLWKHKGKLLPASE